MMFAIILMASALFFGNVNPLSDIFPAETGEWRRDGEIQVYDRKNVFSYMNGAAEFYLGYDFKRLLVQKYSKEGNDDIYAELYEMGSSEDAFGVFHHEPPEKFISVGQMAAFTDGELKFWTGSWMGKILSPGYGPALDKVIVEIGLRIASQLPSDGKKPRLLDALPSGSGRDEDSLRYFHSNLTMHHALLWPLEKDLGLSGKTDCVSAQYLRDAGRTTVLVIRYPAESEARAAQRAIYASYQHHEEIPCGWIEKTDKGRLIASIRIGLYLAIIPDGADRDQVIVLLDKLKDNLRKSG